MERVYLDHNATSPLDPRIRESMLPWLGERHGNPSSLHAFGRAAREALESARSEVGRLLDVPSQEILFCASGSEANNAVLQSIAVACHFQGHLLVSALEHPSVSVTADRLQEAGMEVTLLAPRSSGVIDPDELIEALRPDTRLVCLMLANNEVGTLQPVAEVAPRCRERGIPVLCDAVQAAGKVPVRVPELEVDYLTLAGHKFHGPIGAAALWLRPEAMFRPLLSGGSQERGRRASTENVPAIVGLGRAAALAADELESRARHLSGLRDAFETGLEAIEGATVHCRDADRLPHTSHVAFDGVEGEALVIRLDLAGFAVSTGSACASGALEPSPTLLAMGLDPREALSSIRVSFGLSNRSEEVERFLSALREEVEALRRLAPAGSIR